MYIYAHEACATPLTTFHYQGTWPCRRKARGKEGGRSRHILTVSRGSVGMIYGACSKERPGDVHIRIYVYTDITHTT